MISAMGEAAYYTYVLRCADGTLYTGYTVDMEQRLKAHREGRGAKYTAARRPITLAAQAVFATKHEAMSAEYRFKQLSRTRKLELLARVEEGIPFECVLSEGLGLAP